MNSKAGNKKCKSSKRSNVRREQPRKDTDSKRVNLDNERVDKFDKDVEHISTSNDPNWYAHNEELLRSAASIPFSQTTGQKIGWDGTGVSAVPGLGLTVPGVMGIYFNPNLGSGDLDAINAAKDSIYSFVVHANSRNTSYNSADLMNVIIAGTQVFCAIGSAIRCYGVARMYDQRNKYLPSALIKAMGFDPSSVRNNLSNMWFDINELIARSSQIWIPNTMPIMDRWFWMNSNVYMDSDSVKGQYYIYVQKSFLAYNELYNSEGGGLSWIKTDGAVTSGDTSPIYSNLSSNYTWEQFMTMINGMISLLTNSEDRGVMMGDILKAYGADKIYALSPIPADYSIIPVYDREVLTQIENLDIVGTLASPLGYKQSQSTLRITADDVVLLAPANIPVYRNMGILNFHQKEIPTPAQVMVATRLKALGTKPLDDDDDGKLTAAVPITAGSELVCEVDAFYFDGSNNLQTLRMGTVSADIQRAFITMSFDWAPWMYSSSVITYPAGTAITSVTSSPVDFAMGDYDMYTTIDYSLLQKMNTTALYSLFGVPTI